VVYIGGYDTGFNKTRDNVTLRPVSCERKATVKSESRTAAIQLHNSLLWKFK